MIQLNKVPFSRRGSYFSVSINPWGELGAGLYVHVHYSNSPQVFMVETVREGTVVPHEIEASPSLLRLKAQGGGTVEFVIEGPEAMRVRGSGVSLKLTMPKERWTTAYELPGGAWGINMSRHYAQVAIDKIAGQMDVDTGWERGKGFCWETSRLSATLSAGASERFEAAIDSFLHTWVRYPRPAFDQIKQQVEQEYAAWQKDLPAVAKEYEPARDLAAYVNWSCLLAPAGNLTHETMFMSKFSMCNIYGWDNVFNAMAHATHHPDVAWDQLMVMSGHQDEFGKFPSSMNRNELRFTFTNAPVHGWAMRRMWKENPGMFTPQRLAAAYAFLAGNSNWLCSHRTWPGDGLPYYQHGFDSGWDNSSIFDQGVPMVSPDQPAYLILQLEVLAEIADAIGRHAEALIWRQRAKAMLDALLNTLWKKDHFVGMIRPSGKIVECNSLITAMPMVLGNRLPAEVRKPLVQRIKEHLTPHGLATEKLDSPGYQENGYWRGPIWAPSTMLVTTGLQEIGEHDLANTIMRGFCQMCREHGFAENFHPVTGNGLYCPAYTWTSSVFMLFARDLARSK